MSLKVGDVKFTIDRRKMVSSRYRQTAVSAITDAAEYTLEEANRTVPIEEGTLERSGTVTVDHQGLRAVVSYDTPYAARQHEDTRLKHDPGRRAKWLELTLREHQERLVDFIADRLRRVG